MIRIENKNIYRGEGVYIGRPSLLGNPFKIGVDGTREEVIKRYRVWLWRQIKLRGEVYLELELLAARAKQGDLVLICWCKQQDRQVDCHGDVIKSAAEWMHQQDSSINSEAEIPLISTSLGSLTYLHLEDEDFCCRQLGEAADDLSVCLISISERSTD